MNEKEMLGRERGEVVPINPRNISFEGGVHVAEGQDCHCLQTIRKM